MILFVTCFSLLQLAYVYHCSISLPLRNESAGQNSVAAYALYTRNLPLLFTSVYPGNKGW